MTGQELKEYIEKIGATRQEIAQLLDVDYRTLSRWISGESPVPRMVELLIQAECIRVVDSSAK